MSECSGNCSSCGESCADRKPESLLAEPNKNSHVKKVIAVVSGKGGVGKSTVTSMMAMAMRRLGHTVGILDADITGPSIPQAFGLHEPALGSDDGILPAVTKESCPSTFCFRTRQTPSYGAARSSPEQSSSSGRTCAGAMWTICLSICRPEPATCR